MAADQFRRRVILALAISVPMGLGLSVLGVGLVLTSGRTTTQAASVAMSATSPTQSSSPSPSAAPTTTPPVITTVQTVVIPPTAPTTHQPQGEVVISDWHDTSATNTCVNVQTFYDNRSDTPIYKITQTFQTLYNPIHNPGEYPAEVNGPLKTMTQIVGIPAYTTKEIDWQVCAPELAALQNPPSTTDSYLEEIGAQPRTTKWTWAGS